MKTHPYASLSAAVLLAVLAASGDASANTRFNPGCLIETTPFYQKLQSAGVFDVPATRENSGRPVELLFRIARSIRYNRDKTKHDLWQSADETSKFLRGDCEDKAIWLYTTLRREGYQDVSLHIGKYGPTSQKFHMWVTYVDGGRTLLLDPTMQRRAWDVNAFSEKFYRSNHILTGSDCVSL
jgi:hypothetical protein